MSEENKHNRKRKSFDEIKGTLRKIEGFAQVAFMCWVYYLIWRFLYADSLFPDYHGRGKYILVGVYGILTILIFYLCDAFKYGHLRMSEIIVAQWASLFIVNFVTYWQLSLIANVVIPPGPVILLYVFELFFCVFCVYVFTKIYHTYNVPKNMLMIYGNEKAVNLKFKMDRRSDKYQVTEIISIDEDYNLILEKILKHDAIIVNDVPAQLRNDILKFCYQREIRTYMVPKISDIIIRGSGDINLMDTPLLLVRGKGPNTFERGTKRFFDIIISFIFIVIFSPFMIAIAIAIKVEDGGPIFYSQKRVTQGGKKFKILKFRSMIVDAEKEGKSIPATSHDPRITKTGRLIRNIRFDELPQLFNIFLGSMSIVGPRPERVEHVEKYSREIPEFCYREKVKGGLTGYAQIYGKYNTTAYDKLRLDLMYIENYSLLLDIKLVLMTIPIMFKRDSGEGFDKRDELEEKKNELLKK